MLVLSDIFPENSPEPHFMVTIIVPAHNEIRNLKVLLPQLKGMAADTPTEIMVVVSPDTSDGSVAFTEGEGITCIRSTEKGRAVQMNTAARHAAGDVLAFLHADVFPPDSFLKDISETISSGFDAGFFSYRFDKKSIFLQINASFTSKDGIFTGGGDQCLFIKKEVFEAMDGFDEQQVLMEDFEFFGRMKKRGIRYTIVDKDLIVSARKYRNNSYVRINLANFLLIVLFKCGCPAGTLKTLHDRLIRLPYRHNS